MKFSIGICDLLLTKSGKPRTTEEMNNQNQEKIRTLQEKDTYNY